MTLKAILTVLDTDIGTVRSRLLDTMPVVTWADGKQYWLVDPYNALPALPERPVAPVAPRSRQRKNRAVKTPDWAEMKTLAETTIREAGTTGVPPEDLVAKLREAGFEPPLPSLVVSALSRGGLIRRGSNGNWVTL